jgi:hypothetical protein
MLQVFCVLSNYLFSSDTVLLIGDVKMREPVSPTMKAMNDRLSEANGDKTKEANTIGNIRTLHAFDIYYMKN